MKNFLKMLLASFLGALVAVGICALLFFGAITAMMSFGDEPIQVKKNSILKVTFDTPVVDFSNASNIDLLTMSVQSSNSLFKVLRAIEHAAIDPNIKGIYMDLSRMSTSLTAAEEIRRALEDFKSTGKFIISYADNYSQGSYYFATIADKVYLNPYGIALLTGFSPQVMIFTKTLEKLGIEMQVTRHGKFKSAVEPFLNKEISPENREQILAYTGSIWSFMVEEISKSRDISVEELNRIIDNVLSRNATAAIEHKLVDGIMYKDEVISELCRLMDVESEQKLNVVYFSDYMSLAQKVSRSQDRIAVVYASGEIIMGESSTEVSSEYISKAIKRARHDKQVKAIVFRVDSPGGDAQAAEIIARELELAAKEKPVVVSMGSLAASGGYWISTPASVILANHTTLTGSIGVFGMIPNIQKGMEKYTGIRVDAVNTNKNSDFLTSVYRPLNSTEKEFLQEMVEDIYDKFITKVSNSRSMSKEAVDNIGQGRVWSGVNAYENGLIDEFGGLREAIAVAADRAGLSDYRIVELPIKKSMLDELMNTILNAEASTPLNKELIKVLGKYKYLLNSIAHPGIKARMEYDIALL
ncbi:MAG: signal peptide peptidase SppA [Prevotellaceae bacterium]|jgi:protease-4|nr:signal peptide peptidase SppA [Prevotellaceae bacterium]